jgi:hypothetical protein
MDPDEFETVSHELGDDSEVVIDPDLDILIEEDEEGIEFSPDGPGVQDDKDHDEELRITLDDDEEETEDREIEIDLSQFEDSSLEKIEESEPEENFAMELPDELADISDLAPPPLSEKEEKPLGEASQEAGMDMDTFNMDLELDDFDEGFSLTSSEKESKEDTFAELSLDDIDLSDSPKSEKSAPPVPPVKPVPATKSSETNMDADLDFDLDLGGLTLPPKK